MLYEFVGVKPGTRNHKGCFVQLASGYRLKEINQAGWAVICVSDAVCHHVDPENLQRSHHKELPKFEEL
jgi:hypothetical protein